MFEGKCHRSHCENFGWQVAKGTEGEAAFGSWIWPCAVHGKSPDWDLEMSKDHSKVVITGAVGGAVGVAMCTSSMGIVRGMAGVCQ